jgi:hypothetical protein
LNIKCSFQLKFFNTPPQEHGSLGVKSNIYIIYKEKILISKNEDRNPIFLKRGMKSKTAIKISTEGIDHDKKPLNVLSKGERAITASKEIWVMIFENAAYKNKNISEAEMNSIMIDRDRPDIAVNFHLWTHENSAG